MTLKHKFRKLKLKTKFSASVFGFLLLGLVASACAGGTIASSWPGLAVSGDTAYLAFGPQVHAVNLAGGTSRWTKPEPADNKAQFFANPVITGDGRLVVGSYDKSVRLLDANGNQVWSFTGSEDRILGEALVIGTTAYVPSADSNLYALNLSDGSLQWPFKAEGGLWSQPITDGEGHIFFGSLDHKVYALDAATGKPFWDQPAELGGAIAGSPALSNGVLYVGSFDQKLTPISAATGEVGPSISTDGWVWSAPLVVDGTLYAADLQGNVYALNASDLSERWKIQPEPGSAVRGTPALLNGVLYFATRGGTLYARHANNGEPKWSAPIEGELLGSPVVAGDKVLVAALNSGKLLYAFNAESGAQAWTFGLEGR